MGVWSDQYLQTEVRDRPLSVGTDGNMPVLIYGPNGEVISNTNPLEARVRGLENRLGEVSATPTANTLLARIKALETLLTGIKDTDGVKKITDAVDVEDREARKLGKVQLSGSILALNPNWVEGDPIENKYLELTTEEDNDGNAVLRIVDAAPFAYDEDEDSYKTISKSDIEVVSISTSGEIPAGGHEEVDVIYVGDAKGIYFAWITNYDRPDFRIQYRARVGLGVDEHAKSLIFAGTDRAYSRRAGTTEIISPNFEEIRIFVYNDDDTDAYTFNQLYLVKTQRAGKQLLANKTFNQSQTIVGG